MNSTSQRANSTEQVRAWRAANPEKAASTSLAYRENNKERRNATHKEWREKNPDKMKVLKHRANLSIYGLTPEDYDVLFKAQGGLCAICKKPESTKKKRLGVDHDHVTKRVRGLLCRKCNTTLGNAGDDPSILLAAVAYLVQHKKENEQ